MKDKIIYALVVVILVMGIVIAFLAMSNKNLKKQIVLQTSIINIQKKLLGEKPQVVKKTETTYKPVTNLSGNTVMFPVSETITVTEIPQSMVDEVNKLKEENAQLKNELSHAMQVRKWGFQGEINTNSVKTVGADYRILKNFHVGVKADSGEQTYPGVYFRIDF